MFMCITGSQKNYQMERLLLLSDGESFTFTSQSSFTLKDSLFGAVKITKNTDISKYKYSGYRIGFDSEWSFLHAVEHMV